MFLWDMKLILKYNLNYTYCISITKDNRLMMFREIIDDYFLKYNLVYIVYWWGSQKVRDHWEDLDIGGWTILKWILER
jgi:hypothetical protein